ncbi:hypothetical protein ACFXPS_42620 [Nocardia sp. NPDC059091]|uniref:hypothetical protein n=1 Tax=unclassified Nocardia TaxID=2637762 RepID=UPI0036867225
MGGNRTATAGETGRDAGTAVGRKTPAQDFDRRRALELTDLLGIELTDFPGGHNGNMTHPAAYAETIRRLAAGDR